MHTATALVPGSLGAIAQRDGVSVAESFLSADVIVLVDTSGSMTVQDSRGGRQRYQVACEELAHLQADLPGKVGVVAFSSGTVFVPGGIPPFLAGGTNLAGALHFVKCADNCVRFIVISDGEPDNPSEALAVARTFRSQIDCVYVGPEGDRRGADFLRELAQVGRGQQVVADRVTELAHKVEQLMLTGG